MYTDSRECVDDEHVERLKPVISLSVSLLLFAKNFSISSFVPFFAIEKRLPRRESGRLWRKWGDDFSRKKDRGGRNKFSLC